VRSEHCWWEVPITRWWMSDPHATPLLDAAQFGKSASVQLLLDAGADANALSSLANTSLMAAASEKHAECVRLLLPRTDLAITNRQGCTALHVCVACASEECFKVLLPHYGDVDVRSVQGCDVGLSFNATPLHFACDRGQHEMAKALLKRGASRMARDSNGWTSLHRAALFGHLRCVIVLIGRADNVKMTPAEVNAAAHDGLTPLHFAAHNGREKICGLLIEAGARLDAEASSGHTPLMAAEHFHPSNAALHALLSGAGPAALPGTVCDHCGKTPAQTSVPYLKTCGDCQSMRYCGAACSAAAWSGHKAACKARVAEVADRMVPRIVQPPSAGQ
jgi:ankyrin repeat protein